MVLPWQFWVDWDQVDGVDVLIQVSVLSEMNPDVVKNVLVFCANFKYTCNLFYSAWKLFISS